MDVLTNSFTDTRCSLICYIYYRLNDIALLNKSSQSYGVSLAIRDHTVLPATQHKWSPHLTPARQMLVINLPTPEGWKAELT